MPRIEETGSESCESDYTEWLALSTAYIGPCDLAVSERPSNLFAQFWNTSLHRARSNCMKAPFVHVPSFSNADNNLR